MTDDQQRVKLLLEDVAVEDAAIADIRAAVCRALELLEVPDAAQLAVVLSTDAELRAANATFRHIDAVTDVLSFPAAPGASDPDDPPYLGDILISVETAGRQAEDLGHSLTDELSLLAVHGCLHLLGYDDTTDDGAAEMEALEAKLGVRE